MRRPSRGMDPAPSATVRERYRASRNVQSAVKAPVVATGACSSSSSPRRRLEPPLDTLPLSGLNVCSLLTSIRNTSAEALTWSPSSLSPVSYDQAVIGASVGSEMTPSVERKPLETFTYAPSHGGIFRRLPIFGEKTPWDAVPVPAAWFGSAGVERVLSSSKRAPMSARHRLVRS